MRKEPLNLVFLPATKPGDTKHGAVPESIGSFPAAAIHQVTYRRTGWYTGAVTVRITGWVLQDAQSRGHGA
jgi:hypothetical protein